MISLFIPICCIIVTNCFCVFSITFISFGWFMLSSDSLIESIVSSVGKAFSRFDYYSFFACMLSRNDLSCRICYNSILTRNICLLTSAPESMKESIDRLLKSKVANSVSLFLFCVIREHTFLLSLGFQ